MEELMRLEGIELRFVVNRISDQLDGRHRVDSICVIREDSMLFRLRHPAKDDLFLMVSTFGVWISSLRLDRAGISVQSALMENMPDHDSFGATVKSRYGRASLPIAEKTPLHDKMCDSLLQTRLVGIEQPGAERVAYLTFEGPGGELVMAVELPGRGNIVLCSGRPEMRILALVCPVRGERRTLRVGAPYAPPPSDSAAGAPDILNLSERDFAGLRGSEMRVWEWLVRRLGLPYKYGGGVLWRMKTPHATGAELGDGQIRSIFHDTAQLVRAVTTGPHTPCIVRYAMLEEPPPVGFLAVDVPLDITDLAHEQIPSLMEALDLVFIASRRDSW
ncbi:MAG: NFACT family protein [Thaumarchaeota archaeon]|nr:NFACT family protein [Nitrososphaerota archaeon]MDE0525971.1 NFACT family protein [Nitrososphaerota archaeon]